MRRGPETSTVEASEHLEFSEVKAEAYLETCSQPQSPSRARPVPGYGCRQGGCRGSGVPGVRDRQSLGRLWGKEDKYVCSRRMVNTSKFAAMFLGLFPALVSLQHFYFRAFSLCIMCFSCLRERVRNLN